MGEKSDWLPRSAGLFRPFLKDTCAVPDFERLARTSSIGGLRTARRHVRLSERQSVTTAVKLPRRWTFDRNSRPWSAKASINLSMDRRNF